MEALHFNPMLQLRKLARFLFVQVQHDPQPFESNHYHPPVTEDQQLDFENQANNWQ